RNSAQCHSSFETPCARRAGWCFRRSGTGLCAHAGASCTLRGARAMIARLSFNQITSKPATLKESIDACVRHGIGWIAPWRDRVPEAGLDASARMIREAGLRVSSLCRGGFFPAASKTERQTRIDDNLRAIDEAAALGAPCVVLVCGPSRDRDIDGARRM